MEKLRRILTWVLALVFGLGTVLGLAPTAVEIVRTREERLRDAARREAYC